MNQQLWLYQEQSFRTKPFLIAQETHKKKKKKKKDVDAEAD